MQSIDLGEALASWLSGQKLGENTALYGLSVIWWARLAKVGTFLAGFTLILDLVGPERVRKVSRELRRYSYWWGSPMSYVFAGSALILLQTVALIAFFTYVPFPFMETYIYLPGDNFVSVGYVVVARPLGQAVPVLLALSVPPLVATLFFGAVQATFACVASVFDSAKGQAAFRWSSLALLVTSFSVDLLTS